MPGLAEAGVNCPLCADTVPCHGDLVNKTEEVPALMELTFWWKKTHKTQGSKRGHFR